MPRYKFIGDFETVLHGLAHGVNAVLHREPVEDPETGELVGHGQPAGSTVVARPGDEIETAEPYPHALMVNVATGQPDVDIAPAPVAESTAKEKAAAKRAAAKAAKAAQLAAAPPTDAAVPPVEQVASEQAPADPAPAPAAATSIPANGQE